MIRKFVTDDTGPTFPELSVPRARTVWVPSGNDRTVAQGEKAPPSTEQSRLEENSFSPTEKDTPLSMLVEYNGVSDVTVGPNVSSKTARGENAVEKMKPTVSVQVFPEMVAVPNSGDVQPSQCENELPCQPVAVAVSVRTALAKPDDEALASGQSMTDASFVLEFVQP